LVLLFRGRLGNLCRSGATLPPAGTFFNSARGRADSLGCEALFFSAPHPCRAVGSGATFDRHNDWRYESRTTLAAERSFDSCTRILGAGRAPRASWS
jgi:hypothetical protein